MTDSGKDESKLVKARKLLVEGLLHGTAMAFGGFLAAGSMDLYREWRTGRDSKMLEHAVADRRGSANKAPAIIQRFK